MMFPPYVLTPRQFLRDFTYHDLRVFNVAARNKITRAERQERLDGYLH
jgi:hypothetical protein